MATTGVSPKMGGMPSTRDMSRIFKLASHWPEDLHPNTVNVCNHHKSTMPNSRIILEARQYHGMKFVLQLQYWRDKNTRRTIGSGCIVTTMVAFWVVCCGLGRGRISKVTHWVFAWLALGETVAHNRNRKMRPSVIATKNTDLHPHQHLVRFVFWSSPDRL